MRNTTTTHDAKNKLSGLVLDPRIVVETGENWLSFALGSSQVLECLQGNFQNLIFTIVLLHKLVKKNLPPPQSKNTLSHYHSINKLQNKNSLLLQKITTLLSLQKKYYYNILHKNLLIPLKYKMQSSTLSLQIKK